MRYLLIMTLLIASPAVAWEESVHLPPGAELFWPGLAAGWPTEWAMEYWVQSAPESGNFELDAGGLRISCANTHCVAIYSPASGPTPIMTPTFGWRQFPYSAYVIRLELTIEVDVPVARYYQSGILSGEVALASFGAVTDLVVRNNSPSEHLFLAPVRLWDLADPSVPPPDALLFDPAPASAPGLVGAWRRTSPGFLLDELGIVDAVMLLGAVPGPGICWFFAPDQRPVFVDGFESGDTSKWSVVELGAP